MNSTGDSRSRFTENQSQPRGGFERGQGQFARGSGGFRRGPDQGSSQGNQNGAGYNRKDNSQASSSVPRNGSFRRPNDRSQSRQQDPDSWNGKDTGDSGAYNEELTPVIEVDDAGIDALDDPERDRQRARRRGAGKGKVPTAKSWETQRLREDDADDEDDKPPLVFEPPLPHSLSGRKLVLRPGSRRFVQEQPKQVYLPQVITSSNLSRLLGVKMRSLQTVMTNLGLTDTRPDALIHYDDSSMLCAEYNLVAISDDDAAFDIYPSAPPSESERPDTPFRPPVVAVMGHVDHGKTSLLDRLRSASVAAGEAGGITQHIGAFSVPVKSAKEENAVKKITYLDTPGHAAFSSMRQRGAKVTDIVVLVVAADDGVMTQTKEVINLYHQLEADAAAYAEDTISSSSNESTKKKQNHIQLIVALSKCDRPEANPARVKEQLLQEQISVEDFGGEVPCVEISSKTGDGFETFEETLAAMAELGDLRSPITGLPEGFVLESRTEKGRGNTATVLVTRGTLQPGDLLIAGSTWAKVRQMVDSNGKALKSACPGEAVLVAGWKELPLAGDEVLSAVKEDDIKKALSNRRATEDRKKMLAEAEAVNESRRLKSEEDERVANEEFMERERRRAQKLAESEGRTWVPSKEEASQEGGESDKKEDDVKELRVVLKSDFSGTGEALAGALAGITTKGARIKILSEGVGEINESDLAMARAAGGHIIGFNVSASKAMRRQVESLNATMGKQNQIQVYESPIIYKIIEYVSKALVGLLPTLQETRVLGEATIAEVFSINTKGRQFRNVAGCRVNNGVIERNRMVRVVRKSKGEQESGGGSDGERQTLWTGRMDSLKQVKKEVSHRRVETAQKVIQLLSLTNVLLLLAGI